MKDYSGKVVAVTGAGSGIGRDVALTFASAGAKLSICDIDGDRLRSVREELTSIGCEVVAEVVDVGQAWQVEEYCEKTFREFGRVDVLVNNAGVALGGFVEDLLLEDWQWIVGANYWGVIHGCHYFYPLMIKQGGGGHVVNISSSAAFGPMPTMTAYCSTKSGVLAFSEALRLEAAMHGIGITAICPGVASTNIVHTARYRSCTRRCSPDEVMKKVTRLFAWARADPARVTRAVVKGVERNKAVIPVGPEAYLLDYLPRFSRTLAIFLARNTLRFLHRFA